MQAFVFKASSQRTSVQNMDFEEAHWFRSGLGVGLRVQAQASKLLSPLQGDSQTANHKSPKTTPTSSFVDPSIPISRWQYPMMRLYVCSFVLLDVVSLCSPSAISIFCLVLKFKAETAYYDCLHSAS